MVSSSAKLHPQRYPANSPNDMLTKLYAEPATGVSTANSV